MLLGYFSREKASEGYRRSTIQYLRNSTEEKKKGGHKKVSFIFIFSKEFIKKEKPIYFKTHYFNKKKHTLFYNLKNYLLYLIYM